MRLTDLLVKYPFKLHKTEEAAWGSYNLCVEYHGQMAVFPRRFGWGFTPETAFEWCIRDIQASNDLHVDLKRWLGDEVFSDILTLDARPHDASECTALVVYSPT